MIVFVSGGAKNGKSGFAQDLAVQLANGGKRYYVARKYPKLYMVEPISVNVRSITTDKEQVLYLDRPEMEDICGKRVLIADDVISTGESLTALETLVTRAGGIVAGRAAILAEGDAAKRDDLCFLEELPLFFD